VDTSVLEIELSDISIGKIENIGRTEPKCYLKDVRVLVHTAW